MTVHVVPGRKGVWTVRGTDHVDPASMHGSATEAERAALAYARAHGLTHVVVHDRYARRRVAPVQP
jgi:hypothetical protein